MLGTKLSNTFTNISNIKLNFSWSLKIYCISKLNYHMRVFAKDGVKVKNIPVNFSAATVRTVWKGDRTPDVYLQKRLFASLSKRERADFIRVLDKNTSGSVGEVNKPPLVFLLCCQLLIHNSLFTEEAVVCSKRRLLLQKLDQIKHNTSSNSIGRRKQYCTATFSAEISTRHNFYLGSDYKIKKIYIRIIFTILNKPELTS